MKIFFLGIFAGAFLVPLFGFLYLRFGYVPMAVDGPVIPFEEMLAGSAIQAKIAREAPAQAGLPASDDNVTAGAALYRKHCIECHGLPGVAATPSATGMYPAPPQFFEQKMMGNEPVGQAYWIIRNGIRLTGMPGYKATLTEEQIWQLAQFLSRREALPPSAAAELRH